MEKTKKEAKIVKNSTSFDIIIPSDVEAKIRYLCNVIHDVEWSGVLFYTYTGSIENNDLIIRCKDIFIMDVGSSTYTEYEESTDILQYRIENDLLGEDIQEGLIHSHNNMATFFSSTDTDTLIDEGKKLNHFVSLIVNNDGNYTAGITRKVYISKDIKTNTKWTETSYYNTFNNNKVVLEDSVEKEENKEETKLDFSLEWYDLHIIKEETEDNFSEMSKRINTLKSKKNSIKYPYSNSINKTNSNSFQSWNQDLDFYSKKNYKYPTLFDDYSCTDYHYNDFMYGDAYDLGSMTSGKDELDSIPKNMEGLIKNYTTDQGNYIENLALKILTSCIIVNNKVNARDWVSKMDSIYEKFFGPLKGYNENGKNSKSEEAAHEWFELLIEFVIRNDKASELFSKGTQRGYSSSEVISFIATALYEYLETLPKSVVKDIILDCLMYYFIA